MKEKNLTNGFLILQSFLLTLLDGLDKLDKWPNKVKVMQKNWIGKSFGCEINFNLKTNLPVKEIKCFTTRPDTLFGFSFLALSIDHPMSKFFKKMMNLLNLKMNVLKQALLKSLLRMQKK